MLFMDPWTSCLGVELIAAMPHQTAPLLSHGIGMAEETVLPLFEHQVTGLLAYLTDQEMFYD
jgi:hypothetical protein